MDGLNAGNAKLGSVGAVPGQQFAQAQYDTLTAAPESFSAGLVRADQELDTLLAQVRSISSTLMGDTLNKAAQGTAPQPVPNGVFDAFQILGNRMNSKIIEASNLLTAIQSKLT
jgi:hypothetical protein